MVFMMILRRGRKKGESKEKRIKIGFKISDFQRTPPPANAEIFVSSYRSSFEYRSPCLRFGVVFPMDLL